MKSRFKALLVAAIVLMAVMPGAYGIKISGGGTENGVSNTFATKITASDDADVYQGLDDTGNGPICIDGDFSYFEHNHQATDANGNHAELHAKVTNGHGLSYVNEVVPAKGDTSLTYARAWQWLSAGQSDSIKLSQSASDAFGSKASSTLQVTSGSLMDYEGYAVAGLVSLEIGGNPDPYQHAEAGQKFNYAAGTSIIATEQASDVLGDNVKATTKVNNGEIVPIDFENGYEGWAAAGLGIGSNMEFPEDMPGAIAARMFEADGSTVVADDAVSNSWQTATTSNKVTNGFMGVVPLLAPFSDISLGGMYSVSGFQVVYADGEQINLGASASSLESSDLEFYGGSVSANAKLENGQFEGLNFAGTIFDPGILMAGQEGGANGDQLNLNARAQSTLGQQDYKTAKVLNLAEGFDNLAFVNLYDGSVDIQQGGA